MSVFASILSELDSAALSIIMLKARRLAEELPGRSFKAWVLAEMNGYEGQTGRLPEYRIIPVASVGNFFGTHEIKNFPIPMESLPNAIQESMAWHKLLNGVGGLEGLLRTNQEQLFSPWPDILIRYFQSNRVPGTPKNCYLVEAYQILPKSAIEGVLYAIKARLLEFLLQLGKDNPELKTNDEAASRVPEDKVETLMDRIIFQNCVISEVVVSKQQVNATNITAGGDFVVADQIVKSFNKVKNSPHGYGVTDLIEKLGQALQSLCESISQEQKQEALQDFDSLATEAAKEKPRSSWLKTAGDGLLGLAKAAGNTAVTQLVTDLLKTLGVSLVSP